MKEQQEQEQRHHESHAQDGAVDGRRVEGVGCVFRRAGVAVLVGLVGLTAIVEEEKRRGRMC